MHGTDAGPLLFILGTITLSTMRFSTSSLRRLWKKRRSVLVGFKKPWKAGVKLKFFESSPRDFCSLLRQVDFEKGAYEIPSASGVSRF
jgi:hypothetical protein